MKREILWRTVPNAGSHFIETFNPQMFTMCMGTGILGLALHNLPYQFRGLLIIADLFFVLDIVLFLVFFTFFLIRCCRYPASTRKLYEREVQQTVFLACTPIAFGTIVELYFVICTPVWGSWAGIFGLVLFSLEVLLALATSFGCIWLIIVHEHPDIDNVPPTILYPSISCITAAASGGALAQYGNMGPDVNVPIILISLLLLGFGLGLTMVFLSAYTIRLLHNSLPGQKHAPTSFVCAGPLGQAAYALLLCGTAFKNYGVTYYSDGQFLLPGTGVVVYCLTVLAALFALGFALFWILLAAADLVREGFEDVFTIEFWCAVFPLGVAVVATQHLGTYDLGSTAFKVVGTAGTCLVLLLWLYCVFMSIPRMMTGEFFGLETIKEKREDDEEEEEDDEAARASREGSCTSRHGRGDEESGT